MRGKRKDYRLAAVTSPVAAAAPTAVGEQPWCFKYKGETLDLRPYLGRGYDDVMLGIRDVLHSWAESHINSETFRNNNYALKGFTKFLDSVNGGADVVAKLEDINSLVADRFLEWLRRDARLLTGEPLSPSSIVTQYSRTRRVLEAALKRRGCESKIFRCHGRVPAVKDWLPAREGAAFSDGELRQIVAALSKEIDEIRAGTSPKPMSHRVAAYFLLIATRTGRNTTPLLELSRDALQDNPFRPETDLLVTYKRRGYTQTVHAFQRGPSDVESATPVSKRVGTLYRECLAMTQELADEAKASNVVNVQGRHVADFLFLFRRGRVGRCKSVGEIASLNPTTLRDAVLRLVEEHDIRDDDGKPIHISVKRLRATFGNRIFNETGGDIVAMSRALGNSTVVARSNYLEVTDDMRRNFKFVGQIMVKAYTGRLTESDAADLASKLGVTPSQATRLLAGQTRTGVARCSDPSHGAYAPKRDGELCLNWLNCFRCPNQVIFEDDLHRLFSFYWLLLKERSYMREGQWTLVYGWVIRVIEDVISPKFDSAVVAAAKARADADPFPLWRTREALYGEGARE